MDTNTLMKAHQEIATQFERKAMYHTAVARALGNGYGDPGTPPTASPAHPKAQRAEPGSPESQERQERIKAMARNGQTPTEIARELGMAVPSVLYRLRRRA